MSDSSGLSHSQAHAKPGIPASCWAAIVLSAWVAASYAPKCENVANVT